MFVYGTLLTAGNEFSDLLKAGSRYCGEGKIRGRLYDIGEYPGAVDDQSSSDYIYGSIYELADPEKTIPVLDDYEGFDPADPRTSEFIRNAVFIESGGIKVLCWVYLYNFSTEKYPRIEGGKYPAKKNPPGQ